MVGPWGIPTEYATDCLDDVVATLSSLFVPIPLGEPLMHPSDRRLILDCGIFGIATPAAVY